jgi:TolB protein
MRHLPVILLLLVCQRCLITRAQLVIEITQGVDDPTPIAVVPFAWDGAGRAAGGPGAGRAGGLQPQRPVRAGTAGRHARVSRAASRSSSIATGGPSPASMCSSGALPAMARISALRYELYDVLRQARIAEGDVAGPAGEARMLAHRVSDAVYEKLTGHPRRLRHAADLRVGHAQSHGQGLLPLTLADSDGARPIVLLESREPIMSPSWSPDGKQVAYVSFETDRPAIFRQVLATGEREQLTNFRGLNSSPAWSPDGNTLAMVLSKDGSPDIYLMDLASRRLTRVTRHYAIDTEPSWMPDGRSFLFTSDRGGRPQIYRYDLRSGLTERVTFEGAYNARAGWRRTGAMWCWCTSATASSRSPSTTWSPVACRCSRTRQLDESPSIAPNGSMVLYATKYGDRGILSAVSVDGGIKFRLPSRSGDVREPAWSPYLTP